MTKQTEALKMAYDWLNEYAPTEVVQACKEALEQPAQEPDYWLGYGLQAHDEKPFEGATPLYTHPALQPAQGEIVVTKNEAGQIMLVSRQDSEGNILSVIAESENT